ncbi:hypothetical protein [Streptosporangium sp. NPDC000396]|uniref:hypothetical protein n=1 Tax=Streptosporangium sp. NPDC000396 TaxID=3366185 RepID=UPI0036AAEA59
MADPADHRLIHRIPIAMQGERGTGRGLAFSHHGAYAYVAEISTEGGFSLAVTDTEAHDKVASIPSPGEPHPLAHLRPLLIRPRRHDRRRRVFQRGRSVPVIDTATCRKPVLIRFTGEPSWIPYSGY